MKRTALGAAAGAGLGLALVLRSTLRAPLFAEGSAPGEPWLLTSIPPLPWLAVAGLALGVVGAALGRAGKERLLTPFLPAGLAAAVFVPGAFAAAPFLASFAGRFLDLVLLVGLLLAAARLMGRAPSVRARTVAVGGFVLYLAAGLHLSGSVGISGDEPHYLLVTYSLLTDGDLAVRDDYADEEYRHFYAGRIGSRLAVGTPYSVHGVGVSLLMLPGFALGGLAGVVVTEAILGGLLLGVVYKMARDLTASPSAALFGAAAFGLTSPALFLAVSAYPELPAALVVAVLSWRLLDEAPPSGLAALGLALLVGSLPFLHVKFAPLAAILGGALVFRFHRDRSAVAGIAAGGFLSVAALLAFSYAISGSLDPTAPYGRQRIFLDRIPLGVAGLLLDQEFGLLPSAPVYLVGLAGLASLYRRSRLAAVLALLSFAAILLPGAAHPLWSGGTSAPARFLLPALPLLMVAASCLVAREREEGVGPWAAPLLAASLAVAAAMFFLEGQLHLNARDGTGQVWEALSSSWSLADYLPSLVRGDSRSLAAAAVLAAFVLGAIVLQASRTRLPLPPLVLLLLPGLWAQDLTGVPRSRSLLPRWAADVFHALDERGRSFLALPGFERLSTNEVAALVVLPLEPSPGDGDPKHWWSRSYSIPAGRFEVTGADPASVAFCNGESCFESGVPELSTAVGLGRFRLRASSPPASPALRLLDPSSSDLVALRTRAFDLELRLHGLDDDVYLDPSGFWVRKGSSAAFALERLSPSRGEARLAIVNGGAPNRIRVESRLSTETLLLEPWEEREIVLPLDEPVVGFTVESESGFRPDEVDPRSRDRRELGARVIVRGLSTP